MTEAYDAALGRSERGQSHVRCLAKICVTDYVGRLMVVKAKTKKITLLLPLNGLENNPWKSAA